MSAPRLVARLGALRQKLGVAGGLTQDEELLLKQVEQLATRIESVTGDGFSAQVLVSHATGEGRADVVFRGQVGQLSVVEARETAWVLLEAAAVAETEGFLMRFMKDRVGMDVGKAAMMLRDFRDYRAQAQSSLVGNERPS